MATLVVPPLDEEPWPTLGPQVCDWLETFGVYGPGELAGEPYVIEPEFRAQLYRAYEVYPRGHKLAGRRRFKRVGLSLRKGTAKTEKAMLVALAELGGADAPVRCDGWRKVGGSWEPVGRPVRHAYIPLMATTLEQTEDLGFDVLRFIAENSPLADELDISLERILLLDGRGRAVGKAVPVASAPSSRDGARTTFQHFDETHRLTSPRQVKAHSTMLANVYKRLGADAWSLETTTQPTPGEGSVAEATHAYAVDVAAGKVADPRLFYFHRQASDEAPLDTPEQVREALLEASGPAASWSGDIDGLVSAFFEPDTDREYFRRVWLNQQRRDGDTAFDAEAWAALADPSVEVAPGELVALGFDGSRWDDHTALVGAVVGTGHLFVIGHWAPDPELGVDELAVDGTLEEAFDRWEVARFYADPPKWETAVDRWIGRWGDRVVKGWHTNRPRQMAHALRVFARSINRGELTHDGHPALTEHVANARRRPEHFDLDAAELEEGEAPRAWTIRKEAPDSARKIDLAMAACLAWEARRDAIAAGIRPRKRGAFASF